MKESFEKQSTMFRELICHLSVKRQATVARIRYVAVRCICGAEAFQ